MKSPLILTVTVNDSDRPTRLRLTETAARVSLAEMYWSNVSKEIPPGANSVLEVFGFLTEVEGVVF